MLERKLNSLEKNALNILLPDNKPGYNSYRKKLEEKYLVGSGRFGGSNFVLGSPGDKPDLDSPSSAVFAMGVLINNQTNHYIAIHEEIEGTIEIELDGIDKLNPENGVAKNLIGWSYSDWMPGSKAPNDNSAVREVKIGEYRYILVLAPAHRRIWLYEFDSMLNHLIPVTNFFNELLMLKRIRTPMQTKTIFEQINNFTNEELQDSFINYARYMNKFKVDDLLIGSRKEKRKKSFNIFNR